ncbi:MAG: citrate synthase [Planctomycetes bacterium]|nr:citrate synthase [Planctomycetota bacterium]
MDKQQAPKTARLILGDKQIDLPVMVGTENELAIDIRKLRSETGAITFDPGMVNTGSCESRITFLDGEKGILRYAGYPIEQLAEKSSFTEVAWLLLKGELPMADELASFEREISRHTMVHEDFRRFFSVFPKAGHPMAICAAAIGALSTFYGDVRFDSSEEERWKAAVRLLAKMPTIASYSYKHHLGQPFMYPRNELDYTANVLHMMFATPCEPFAVDPVIVKALDLLLILHADHEQNCSTSTVRTVASAQSNLFASVSAGISALWGPLHGGANQKVIEMLISIREGKTTAKKFMELAKSKDSGVRLMGFGHRVYKNYDPRARILKQACHDVLARTGANPLLEIAMELEGIALSDQYFVERKLYPNVDFYSGIIYQALGIPIDMFTVFFALGRLPGWIAQWMEFHDDPNAKILRPRQIYMGSNQRDYLPRQKRVSAAKKPALAATR